MITLIATLTIKEGMMDEAIDALNEAIPALKESEPDLIEYIPHRVKGEDNTIIFYEKYRDKEALELHSKNIVTSLGKFLPLLEGGIDIKICKEIF